MATRIRLRKVGRKKQASFRIVVAGGMHARSGRVTETIGKYNPRTEPTFIEVDEKRALYWLSQGAQPSGKVESLFRQTGIMKKLADGVEGEGVVSIGRVDGKTNRPPAPEKKSKKAEAKAAAPAEEAVAPPAPAEEAPAVEAAAPPAATDEAPADEAPADAAAETPAAEAPAAEEAESDAETEKQDAE
jgi:small subunit ribosomal protein S16